MPRFVILFHRMPNAAPRGDHWDLMLQQHAGQPEETLATWALADEPSVGVEIAAEALADHRPAYLDYEGPISGKRGEVTRWDAGTFRRIEESDERWVVELSGDRLRCRVELIRQEGHCWRVRFGGD